ncbi:MAG: filamentous hemagglutinin N-terminal domain-containing protein, partial [Cyanobacteria bacterium J06649_4]
MRWHETPSRLAGILPIGAVVLASSLLSGQALAQSVTSDASGLTTVTPGGGGTFSITGGSPSGTNLFHSFDEFSIPHSGSATFNNALTVSNIISRVTGTAASDIQGTISAQGTANLFLINPNGIVFGPNAQLAIGGSFIGSTAESIQFQNGVSYLASDTTPNPMLSVSVPIGLQLGASSQTIRVEDTGATALFPQPAVVDSSSSLLVNSGQTFALIGNGITFQGGKVAIPGGRIALGSVQEGLVTLNAAGWIPSYENITNFADIDLIERSLLNASSVLFDTSTIALDPITGQPQPLNPVTGIVDFGTPLPVFPAGQGGNIQLDGRRLSMSGSSLALIQNFGPLASGSVDVHARERVELADADVSRVISSGLITNHLSSGGGGGINVTTPQLLLINDGLIATDTFSPANNAAQAGKITLRTDNIEITDVAQVAAGRRTLGGITASSSGTGQGGVIDIETDTLNISGDGIASGANRLGTAGNVIVVADALRITNS